MSRWQNWVESQQKTVEADGVCAVSIRLEGPDNAVWGTWSTKTEDLSDVIEQTIELLVEDLPKERHSCRLVSYDSKGEQLAIMPHAVMGRSAEAGKQANRDRSHAQATAVHLGNAEQVLGIQSRQLERQKNLETELFEDNLILRQKLVELMTDTMHSRTSEKIAEERLAVFRELVATSKPLLEAVIAMGAEFATYKFSEVVEGLKRKQLAEESLTSENERLKTQLAELKAKQDELKAEQERWQHEQGEKRKPVDGAIPDGPVRTRKTRGDGQRSSQGNRGRTAGNGRCPPTARTRGAGR